MTGRHRIDAPFDGEDPASREAALVKNLADAIDAKNEQELQQIIDDHIDL